MRPPLPLTTMWPNRQEGLESKPYSPTWPQQGKGSVMQAHRLYVGTIGEGVFRSTDNGETFARAMDGMFVECHVRALTIHPREPSVVYLGCEQGLFRSRDGAGSWERV